MYFILLHYLVFTGEPCSSLSARPLSPNSKRSSIIRMIFSRPVKGRKIFSRWACGHFEVHRVFPDKKWPPFSTEIRIMLVKIERNCINVTKPFKLSKYITTRCISACAPLPALYAAPGRGALDGSELEPLDLHVTTDPIEPSVIWSSIRSTYMDA